MLAPRLLLIMALLGPPGAVFAGTETAPVPDLPVVTVKAKGPAVPLGPDEEPGVEVLPAVAEGLKKIGWNVQRDGGLERLEGADKGVIPAAYLDKANLHWRDGLLRYSGSPEAVDKELYAPMLKGLSTFASAARVDRAKAGAALAAWGIPPTIDGRRIYNPAGDATYFGIMLHSFFVLKPEKAAALGIERAKQAVDLIEHAYFQAFSEQAPDVAQTDLDRAQLLLFAPFRGGETPLGSPSLKARPDPAAMLKGYKDQVEAEAGSALKAGDAQRHKDSVAALAVLNTLGKHRFYARMDLNEVPEPGKEKSATPAAAKDEPYTPLSSGLPGLLKVLDRIGGAPLTSEQQENLIKTFPMGDLIWRMGAQDLWKQGLTGKGIRVAVIDEGIGENQEIDNAVKGRVNFTGQRGVGAVGDHGTHVAGIIHALAPDAELRGYAALESKAKNKTLTVSNEDAIIAAIRRAVADGNQIVNMSLGSDKGPTSRIATVVEEYASKGVIFLIAAGNDRNANGGVESPSSAPSAITVGSLDSAGRMADSSGFGERFNPKKMATAVKDVFLLPGENIISTVATPQGSSDKKPNPRYEEKSGTSMATPALSGISALLVQDMGRMTLVPNPIEAAQRLKAALVQGSTPIELAKLPPTIPLDQPFYVVHPIKALEALRTASVPVAGK